MDQHRRKLVAIVFTDIVGFTEITSSDEGEAIRLLQWQRNTFQPMVEEHGGEWLKELGDGLLLSFPSSQDAVRCAIRIQEATREKPDLQIRIGIHQGDIIQEGPDILGDGVNIAARLQQIAPRGGIALSDKVQQDISGYPEFEVISLGQHSLKGVARSMEIYGLSPFGFPEIPEYRLLRLTGQGAYGEVWLAQSLTGVYRAVKIVHRDQFEDAKPYEREFTGITGYEPVSRKHEGLIDLLHVGHGQDDSFFYYVMELADDQRAREEINPREYRPRTLQSELEARGKLSIGECLEVGSRLARGLAFLHDHNLLHRDVKPANIVYVDGHPKLADIGLITTTDNASTLVGTMGYIPPEGPGKPSSDIYALGMVLYELSTGKDRADFPEIDVLDPELRGLNQACLKACSNDLSERFANAHAFAEELDQLARGKSTPDSDFSLPQSSNLKMGALAAALIAILALVLYQQSGDPNEKNGEESTRNNGGKPDEHLTTDEPKSPSTNSLTNGLVAYYPFNGNAKDESGNGNDGLAANVKYVSGGFGPGGKMAEFAKGSSIKLNASKLPQGNLARTMSCFVRVTGAQPGTETTIASWGNAGSNNQTFAFYGDSFDEAPKANGFLAWSQWGSGVSFTTKENEAKQDVWYHITATFDGKTLVTYLNGKKADQKSFTLATGAGDLVIGQSDFRRILEGHVDEFRIYNRALSDENVADLYKHDIGNTEPAFLKEGLVAYYPFNGNAKDESGHGNDGELIGANLTADRHGEQKRAMEFNAPEAHIRIRDKPELDLGSGNNQEKTILFWMHHSENPAGGFLAKMSGKTSLTRDYAVGWGPGNGIVWGTGPSREAGSSTVDDELSVPCRSANNLWSHIAVSYSYQSSGKSFKKVYFNGKLIHRGPRGNGKLPANRADLIMGRGWRGKMDDVRIYNRALEDDEVALVYSTEKPRQPQGPTQLPLRLPASPSPNLFMPVGLVAYYPFDGNSRDESKEGNHLDVYGATLSSDRFGKAKSAYRFDGKNDFAVAYDSDSLDMGTKAEGWAVSCWVNPQQGEEEGSYYIINKSWHTGSLGVDYGLTQVSGPTGQSYRLGISTASRDPGGWAAAPVPEGISHKGWRHIVATVDASQKVKRVYVNGRRIASINYQHKNPANNHALRVGSGNGRHSWKGDLDDIRIYNRALPAKEVENLYDFEKVRE